MSADVRTVLPDPELALLASCLTQGSAAYYEAMEHVTAEDLTRASHRALWRAIGRLADSGTRPDAHVVWEALGEDRTFLDEAGGAAYLVSLSQVDMIRGNTGAYAKQVHERAVRSRLRQLLVDAVQSIDEGVVDVDGLQEQVFRLAESRDQACTFDDALGEVMAELDQPADADMMPFPWFEIQHWTRGLRPGRLYLLAGESGHGKTAAALSICDSILAAGRSILYINLEMERRELVLRLAQLHGYDADKHYARHRDLDTNPLFKLGNRLKGARRQSWIKHVERVAQMPALIRRYRPDLLVIDHIGLLEAEGRSPYERVSNNSRALKMLAKRYQLPVLCLCQLSRNTTGGPPVTLDRLRDSGRIGEDSDVVLFVWRERNDKGELMPTGRFVVAKSRMGRQGAVDFEFSGETQKFVPRGAR